MRGALGYGGGWALFSLLLLRGNENPENLTSFHLAFVYTGVMGTLFTFWKRIPAKKLVVAMFSSAAGFGILSLIDITWLMAAPRGVVPNNPTRDMLIPAYWAAVFLAAGTVTGIFDSPRMVRLGALAFCLGGLFGNAAWFLLHEVCGIYDPLDWGH